MRILNPKEKTLEEESRSESIGLHGAFSVLAHQTNRNSPSSEHFINTSACFAPPLKVKPSKSNQSPTQAQPKNSKQSRKEKEEEFSDEDGYLDLDDEEELETSGELDSSFPVDDSADLFFQPKPRPSRSRSANVTAQSIADIITGCPNSRYFRNTLSTCTPRSDVIEELH